MDRTEPVWLASRIGNALLRGRGAGSSIHGVLPAVGAGERGYRQKVRLVEAGLWAEGGDPTLALRIARLVGVGVDDVLVGSPPPVYMPALWSSDG
jgi:hypothetical protein